MLGILRCDLDDCLAPRSALWRAFTDQFMQQGVQAFSVSCIRFDQQVVQGGAAPTAGEHDDTWCEFGRAGMGQVWGILSAKACHSMPNTKGRAVE
jgi:hypothetical protein